MPLQLTIGMQVVTHLLPEASRNGRLGTLRYWDPLLRCFQVRLYSGRLIYLVEPFHRVVGPDDLFPQVPAESQEQKEWELPPHTPALGGSDNT